MLKMEKVPYREEQRELASYTALMIMFPGAVERIKVLLEKPLPQTEMETMLLDEFGAMANSAINASRYMRREAVSE